LEPVTCQDGDLFQGPWLFEQMRGARYNLESLLSTELAQGLLVEIKHLGIPAAHNQKRRRPDPIQDIRCQVGASSPGDNGVDGIWPLDCRLECSRSTRAGPEIADTQPAGIRMLLKPVGCPHKPPGQKADVKAQMPGLPVDHLFFRGKQVDQQGSQPSLAKCLGNKTVARAEAAAPAAVGKKHDPLRSHGDPQVAL
jgi:hypothetical protein